MQRANPLLRRSEPGRASISPGQAQPLGQCCSKAAAVRDQNHAFCRRPAAARRQRRWLRFFPAPIGATRGNQRGLLRRRDRAGIAQPLVSWRQAGQDAAGGAGQVQVRSAEGLGQLLPAATAGQVIGRGPCRGWPGTVPTSTLAPAFSSRRPRRRRPWARLDCGEPLPSKSTETGRPSRARRPDQSAAPGDR